MLNLSKRVENIVVRLAKQEGRHLLASTNLSQSRETVSRNAHNVEIEGSIPSSAILDQQTLSTLMASTRLSKARDIAHGKFPDTGVQRSSQWASVRKKHLKENPKCAVCEGTERLNVHHIQPFHLHPELELEPTNLITLCECASYGIICHILIGHLGDYKNVNPNVLEDAKTWNAKLKEDHFQK